jgi:hypothetical protein
MKAVVRSLLAIASLYAAEQGGMAPVDAADLGPRPLLAPDSSWTGFYAGINAGALWADGDAR